MDDAFARTDTPRARWHLVPADRKWYARVQVLGITARELARHAEWLEARLHEKHEARDLKKALKQLAG